MKVLGLDSAGGQCAAAVLDGSRVLAARTEPMARGQSERLLPLIADTLAAAGLAPMALDLIAVTTGPGSFTGIRVGLAAARGLALATGRLAIGVDVFDAYAATVPPAARSGRTLVVAIESKREEFYLQAFIPVGKTPAAQVLPRDVATWVPPGPLMLAGDAASRLRAALGVRDTVIAAGTESIDPAQVARLGRTDHAAGRRDPPRPFYLRAPDTTTPRRAGPMSAISLRPATTADLDALARLHAASFPEDPWEQHALAQLLALSKIHARVVMLGARPVGFVVALVVAGEAEILTLCVDPDVRRSGFARALLADLYTTARAARSVRIVLEVAADNAMARALYAAEGFAAVGRRPFYYRRPQAAAVDALILARSLT